ncbi:hypothetical protein HMPREF1979_00427 [Actinomyces johnsonii F0542]|uniref:Uncharacterized protein n=1 Tax=Actinomyces johnsonii F0542 TaxID=1321818 RepID=U1QVH4_9ACTO|nr:hypothetical protein HMPREF1979_00427 [Actinomyces johnsonii F0542]
MLAVVDILADRHSRMVMGVVATPPWPGCLAGSTCKTARFRPSGGPVAA